MADGTKIQWTDATWQIVTGCDVVSPGCTNCYAMKLAGTRLRNHATREGLTRMTKAGPVWTGDVRFNRQYLDQPERWQRPRKIFVAAHGDLFHEKVPDEWLDEIFAVMARCPQHIFQVLTKRPERARAYLTALPGRIKALAADSALDFVDLPLPNVWIGTSVEDQRRANQRIPDLLETPAAVRWLSMEPLLGPVGVNSISTFRYRGAEVLDALTGTLSGMFGDYCPIVLPKLDWIVVGGESGPGWRPMDIAWVRSLRAQCRAAGVPFYLKQLSPVAGNRAVGDIDAFPDDLRVREWPAVMSPDATMQPLEIEGSELAEGR